MTFDLTGQPWIPVLVRGQRTEVSLRDALDEAHSIDGLAIDDPLQSVALFRQVLLPVVLHALGAPRSEAEWAQRFATGRFDVTAIHAYLDEHAARFDLFHPNQPFAQVGGLSTGKNETKPISLVVAHLASGNNVPLFSARTDADPPALSPAQAVRTLLAAHCWDTAAIKTGAVGDPNVKPGSGKTTGNPTGPLGQLGVVVPLGATLFETLMLSVPILPQGLVATDVPQWAGPVLGAGWTSRHPRGVLDLLTWQSRRIRLMRDTNGDAAVVRAVVLCAGDRIDRLPYDREPHTAWKMAERRTSDDPQWRPERHQPGRSAWRGLATLAATRTQTPDKKVAPHALRQVAALRAEDYLPSTFPLKALFVGVVYGNQQAVIDDVVSDVLPLPTEALLDHEDNAVRETLLEIVGQAEELRVAANQLGDNLRAAAGAQKMSWERGQRLGELLVQSFDLPARRVLDGLQQYPHDAERAALAWRLTARNLALGVAEPVLDSMPSTTFLGRRRPPRDKKQPKGKEIITYFDRASTAENLFRHRVNDILGKAEELESALRAASADSERKPE